MNLELSAVQIIANSGQARSLAFEALHLAKSGNQLEANLKMQESQSLLLEAHKFQTSLIQEESAGNNITISLLMVHAQDHLMTSILAKDLIKEMLDMLKK